VRRLGERTPAYQGGNQMAITRNTARHDAVAALAIMFMGSTSLCMAQSCQPKNVLRPIPTMTIKIINNSTTANLYPVLSVGGGTPATPVVDSWMQAWFSIKPEACLGTDVYYRSHIYRLYINPTGTGIPPRGIATITLPLYSQLVDTIDPTKGDQLIDWWQGGGVRMFYALQKDGAPPPALTADYSGGAQINQAAVIPVTGAATPKCTMTGGTACTLATFEDTAELSGGDPYQLQEYTLGAVNASNVPYLLNTKNVDFDVSYVDSAFMPMMVEPFPNKIGIYGWVGIDGDVGPFHDTVEKWLKDFSGWPQFVDNRGATDGKVPSPINLFIGNIFNPKLDDPARADLQTIGKGAGQASWAPIKTLITNWTDSTGPNPTDPNILAVSKLFAANYANYDTNYDNNAVTGWNCNTAVFPNPIQYTLFVALGYAYGWTPLNYGCSVTANQIYQTPGYYDPADKDPTAKYQKIKTTFDNLQINYQGQNDKTKFFNPYVDLIHGADYLNAQYVYAFSVDDGVGNVQVDGETGFYIAVGSPNGLPNVEPLGALVNFTFGYSPNDKVRFTKYGVCTDTPDIAVDPSYTTFVMSVNKLTSCPYSLIDNLGNLYHFGIKKAPNPPGQNYPNEANQLTGPAFVDCKGNTNAAITGWCNAIFGQLVVDSSNGNTQNVVITGAAPQSLSP
jgi:hypothetical protein